MNLWPFAKKNDIGHTGHLPSKKMELPPGVKLASPTEADLPPSPTAIAPSPAAPDTEIAVSETTPEPPSLQDMDLFPAQEAAAVIAPPKDLPEFFEQNQLEMISTGAPSPETKASLPVEPQNTVPETLTALTDEAFAPPDSELSPFELAPSAETLFSAEELPSPEFATTNGDPSPALDADFSLSPDNNWNPSFDPAHIENDTTDLFLAPLPDSEPISGGKATTNFSPVDGFNTIAPWETVESPASPEALDGMTPEWSQTDLSVAAEDLEQPIQQPLEQVLEQTQTMDPDWLSPQAETPPNHSTDIDSFYMYPTQEFEPGTDLVNTSLFAITAEPWTDMSPVSSLSATTEDSNPTPQGTHSAQAIYEDGYTEIPVPLNLPDEILAPANDNPQLEVGSLQTMGLEAIGMKAISMEPMDGSDYLEDDLNDESFDLDSLLLGQAHAEQNESYPLTAMPESTAQSEETVCAYDLNVLEDVPYALPNSTDTDEAYTDEASSNHYFGDEAQGLKAVDNLESYDFGHYEDPDEPAEAFELTADPTPLANNLSYDQYYVASEKDDLSFGAKQLTEATEAFNEADASSDYDPDPIQAGEDGTEPGYASFVFDEPKKSEASRWAETTPPSPKVVTETVTETTKQNIPVQAPTTPQSSKVQSYQPEAEAAPKQRVESISEALDNFGQDILLNNNRFLSRSIDRLVDHYFAQKHQNHG